MQWFERFSSSASGVVTPVQVQVQVQWVRELSFRKL